MEKKKEESMINGHVNVTAGLGENICLKLV